MSTFVEPGPEVSVEKEKRTVWRSLRRVLFWVHLCAGLIAAPVILIMSVTGVLLTYEKQMTRWANAGSYEVVVPDNSQRLPAAELVSAAAASEGKAPSALTIRAGKNEAAEVSFGREKTLYLNPYSGKVLGTGSESVREFFHSVTDWHRWLAQPEENKAVGKLITGVCNLAFLLLVVSGLILWFPRKWSMLALRSITWFRGNLSGRARYYNWHNTIGFWCLVPLFIIVVSASVISFPWASNLVYKAVGDEPPPQRARSGSPSRGGERTKDADDINPAVLSSLDGMIAKAGKDVEGWRGITVQLPTKADDPVAVNIDAGSGGQPQKKKTLEFDTTSGDVVKSEGFSDLSAGRRLRSILRFAHTGEVAGIFGQTIAGIASLGGAVLVITGALLSWRRWWGRKKAAM